MMGVNLILFMLVAIAQSILVEEGLVANDSGKVSTWTTEPSLMRLVVAQLTKNKKRAVSEQEDPRNAETDFTNSIVNKVAIDSPSSKLEEEKGEGQREKIDIGPEQKSVQDVVRKSDVVTYEYEYSESYTNSLNRDAKESSPFQKPNPGNDKIDVVKSSNLEVDDTLPLLVDANVEAKSKSFVSDVKLDNDRKIIRIKIKDYFNELGKLVQYNSNLDELENKFIGNVLGLAFTFLFLLIFLWLNRRMVVKILISCCSALDFKSKRTKNIYRYERQMS